MAIANMTYQDLRQRRERADIPRETLAVELGCSLKALELFENGKRPLPHRLTPIEYNAALVRIWERRKPQ